MRILFRACLLSSLIAAPGCAQLQDALAPKKTKAQQDDERFAKQKEEAEAQKQKDGDAEVAKADAMLKKLREDTQATVIRSDADVEAAYRKVEHAQKDVDWHRLARHEGAFRDKLNAEVLALQVVLARKAADAGTAAKWGRTALYRPFIHLPKQPSEEIHDLARELGAQFDAARLAQFQEYGWCKVGPASNDVVCAFSDQPFPEDLSEVRPVLKSHLEGDVVYVLARLPQPARAYGGRTNAQLALQIYEDTSGTLYERVTLGSPEALGDAEYLRATFRLPPEKARASMRHWIDANVVLTWEVPAIPAPVKKHEVFGRASFTWHEPK